MARGPRVRQWLAPAQGGGVLIRVHAQPGARSPGVGDVDPWRGALAVRVSAPARGGQANDALCAAIAQALGVPRAAVEVRSGARDRDKLLHVSGITLEVAASRLGGRP